jgi:hypothetical protein
MLGGTDHSAAPEHIAEAFNLDGGGHWSSSHGIDVHEIATSAPANVLNPGDRLSVTLQIQNNSGQPLTTTGKLEVIRYNLTTLPDNFFAYQINSLGASGDVPVPVTLPASGVQDVPVNVPIPATFGGYALILDLGPQGGRHLAGLCIRTFKMPESNNEYPVMTLDELDHTLLDRLGIHSVRNGTSYKPTTDRDFQQYLDGLKPQMDDLKAHHITCMVDINGGQDQILGRGIWLHMLDDQNRTTGGFNDTMWPPAEDADFTKYITILTSTYGWPKGPVTAVCLYNEPWDGGGISGWMADMPRYREAYMAMAKGVLKARSDAGVQVLVGGTDSTTNGLDKLFGDGTNTYLPVFDYISMHYQGLDSRATLPLWHDRKGPYGRVRFWDTESWVANTDDRKRMRMATTNR